jgi:hypothetical protein
MFGSIEKLQGFFQRVETGVALPDFNRPAIFHDHHFNTPGADIDPCTSHDSSVAPLTSTDLKSVWCASTIAPVLFFYKAGEPAGKKFAERFNLGKGDFPAWLKAYRTRVEPWARTQVKPKNRFIGESPLILGI